MREDGGDIRYICFEAQTWAMKQSSFKVPFIMHLGHRRFSTTCKSGVGNLFITTNHTCGGMAPAGRKNK